MTGRPERGGAWSTERVDGVLSEFVRSGVVGDFEIQLAAAACRADPAASDGALLALALVARATRLGHVCVDLDLVGTQVAGSRDDPSTFDVLAVPETVGWIDALEVSALVASPATARSRPLRPMVWDGGRLYLQRYWAFEVSATHALEHSRHREASGSGSVQPDPGQLAAVLDPLFPEGALDAEGAPDLQRLATERALVHPVTVIAGGPGTGKTHTVAAILAASFGLAEARGEVLRAALCAPTGKAAARMQEAVDERVDALVGADQLDPSRAAPILAVRPTTIHRLLGALGRSGFRHDRDNPLPHDLVIVDETSMVSLPLLARLLVALRPGARLVLVGDPYQLSSIEAGTVMSDLVGPWRGDGAVGDAPLAGRVTELVRGRRFESDSATADLAVAIRKGEADQVMELLGSGRPDVHWVRPDEGGDLVGVQDEVVDAARQVVAAAVIGDTAGALAAATRIKVLAAVRKGPNGVDAWTELISSRTDELVPLGLRGGWPQLGTPVMVTANNPLNQVANGDVGVVVNDGGRWVAMSLSGPLRRLAPARLGAWEPWWAMTIHKSQGSEFAHTVVALPTVDSPILTRELLYTAVTRAKPEVTVVGTEEMIRLAVSRPIARASGLCDRLWPST